MANLPTPQSQANLIQSVTKRESSFNAADQIIAALPDVMNAYNRKQASDASATATQAKAEKVALEESALADGIESFGGIVAGRAETIDAFDEVTRQAAMIESYKADGIINDDEKAAIKLAQKQKEKFQQLNKQFPLDISKWELQKATWFQTWGAQNKHAAGIYKDMQATINGGDSTSAGDMGKRAKEASDKHNKLVKLYGNDYSLDQQAVQEARIKTLTDIKESSELGNATFAKTTTNINAMVYGNSFELSTRMETMFNAQGGINNDQKADFAREINLNKNRALQAAADAANTAVQGAGYIDQSTIDAKLSAISKPYDELIQDLDRKDLGKVLAARNTLWSELYKAEQGLKLDKVLDITKALGDVAGEAILATVKGGASNAKIITDLALAGGVDPGSIDQASSIVMDALSALSKPRPVPGYSRLEAYLLNNQMSSPATSVTDLAVRRAIEANDFLADNMNGVSSFVKLSSNEPFAVKIMNAEAPTKALFAKTVQGKTSLLMDQVRESGYGVSWENDKLVVHKTIDVSEEISKVSTGDMLFNSVPKGQSLKKVNTSLSKSLNELLGLYRNENYVGILPKSSDIVKSFTNAFPAVTKAQ